MKTIEATLCFLIKDNAVLLGKKTRRIGVGCWNGYGGKIEAGESPEFAAVRELREETGIITDQAGLKKCAVVDFKNIGADGEEFLVRVHVYLVSVWRGEPSETEEMITPTWFPIDALPLSDMMAGDRAWLTPVLNGKTIRAVIMYDMAQKTMIGDPAIEEVSFEDLRA